MIVTNNLGDFPDDVLAPLGMEAQSADSFILNVLELAGGEVAVRRVLEEQSAALSRPPRSVPEIVGGLERAGLVASAVRLRELTS